MLSLLLLLLRCQRVMTAGANMPAIEGVTVGMTRENCMAYCYNKKTPYKYFGESL